MKVHPIIAIIIGLIVNLAIILFLMMMGIGTVVFIISIFLAGIITEYISKTKSLWVAFSVGLIFSVVVVIQAVLRGYYGISYEFWLLPFISALGGWITLRFKN